MKGITQDFVLELKELDFSFQEYSVLRAELSDKEIEGLDKIGNTKEMIARLFDMLNDKQRLPEKYKDRVEDYKGFKGRKIDFNIIV